MLKESATPCRKCGAKIFWNVDPTDPSRYDPRDGKWLPYNADGTKHICNKKSTEEVNSEGSEKIGQLLTSLDARMELWGTGFTVIQDELRAIKLGLEEILKSIQKGKSKKA